MSDFLRHHDYRTSASHESQRLKIRERASRDESRELVQKFLDDSANADLVSGFSENEKDLLVGLVPQNGFSLDPKSKGLSSWITNTLRRTGFNSILKSRLHTFLKAELHGTIRDPQ